MIKFTFQELAEGLTGEKTEFPKYTSWIINQLNRISQATRPKVVGQMSDLIRRCPEGTFQGWKRWYLETHPEAIENATKKIQAKLHEVKKAFDDVDEDLIRKWVEDLVIVKTFLGLRVQEAILKKLAEMAGKPSRLATPGEESRGIDGFIGDEPVSIKPKTYTNMKYLKDKIDAKIIFYKKTDDGVIVDAADIIKVNQKTLKDAL